MDSSYPAVGIVVAELILDGDVDGVGISTFTCATSPRASAIRPHTYISAVGGMTSIKNCWTWLLNRSGFS